ncbi:putative GPI-anchored wall transfer protein [Suhomyces tanzawaensis NRRL Y-17324]|uniref:GPI-anchored wall transfer protein n=1 Tax=Suhomyces tanzawaensis NRRL Y-17324 TaxID=984487 RepID=A0A1E4SB67_9ASCO|nr:putative GPI-anchored wall transfer protein [Suhomyces tanzawaensis NRRL Y-17324]ODV76642.1 putative GPI-anchored wall transfer protein [Suhomyces tanzawaensis NRRL Y-17324]
MASLKEQKQLFVSDLLGGSISEIYLLTSISITSWLSYSLAQKSLQKRGSNVSLTFDFIFNAVTLLAAMTIYSPSLQWLHWMVIIPGVAVAVWSRNVPKKIGANGPKNAQKRETLAKKRSNNSTDTNGALPPDFLPKKPFITAYRSHMMIITNLAILAVDFPVFPRRFAKVETWGTSLMDLGVGSFVFSMGLVHSRSIIKAQTLQKARFNWQNYLRIVAKGIRKSVPLTVLGLVRLFSVKGLDYQEHVTEYGVHWNFFMTLGLFPTLLALMDPVLVYLPRALVAFGVSVAYEVVLHRGGLLKYVLTEGNRYNNVFSMNKEGISSFFGYLSIFIFGQSFGSFVLPARATPYNLVQIHNGQTGVRNKRTKTSWFERATTVSTTRGLVIAAVFYQAVFAWVSSSPWFSNISRRLVNFPYVAWVLSYNATFLLGYHVVSQLVLGVESRVLNSTNSGGLGLFLVANLLTGLVNMSINTLQCSDAVAFGILVVYAVAVVGIGLELDRRKLYLKL